MSKTEIKTEKIKVGEEAFITSGHQFIESNKNRKILTACLSADIGLGGGIPQGCTILMGGRQKSGKTSTALTYGACAQKTCGSTVFYFNIEGRLDNKVLHQVPELDLDKFKIIMGPAITDSKDKVVGHKKMSSQEWWGLIGKTIIDNPNAFVIVDSVSAMSEASEIAEGMGYQSRGGLQKLEAQFTRQYADLVVPNRAVLFMLAQVQANTSGQGEALQMKCGNSLRFHADAIVFIRYVEKWVPDKNGRILGQDMVWRIEASPLGPPFVETKVPLRFGKGLDKETDIINNAVEWGVIKLAGSWYHIPFEEGKEAVLNMESENKIKLQGVEQVRNWFNANKTSLDLIDQSIRKIVFN